MTTDTPIQQKASLNDLHMAPRKVRLIANLIKGLPIQEAEAQLILQSRRAAKPLVKLLRSAVANAKNNKKLNPDQLLIKSIVVNQGTILKRFLPRAMGRATPIQKKISHITMVLEETKAKLPKRFTFIAPIKKTGKKKTKPKSEKPKSVQPNIAKPQEKVGFFRKLFRRKTI